MYLPTDPYLSRNPLRQSRNRLLARITAPASEPVTLTEAKLYLRIDTTDDDTLINDLIVAARMTAENWLKRSLITQAWKLSYDYFLPEPLYLPMGPVTGITSVIVTNADNSTTTVDSSTYRLSAAQNMLISISLIRGQRIDISYATGYGNASAVPLPIKQGILCHIAALYDTRGETGGDIPPQAIALYETYREVQL